VFAGFAAAAQPKQANLTAAASHWIKAKA